MVFLISLLLIAQGSTKSKPLWATSDILIEDSLGSYVTFAADYNYTTGDIYVVCYPDSGNYFHPDSMGILLFHSSDHGATWDLIFKDVYYAEGWLPKDIDLVVTRSDTVYVLWSWVEDSYDILNIEKIYQAGGTWESDWPMPDIDATEIRSPKLIRDDFDDFYLYMAYLDITAGDDSLIVLFSEDRGENWDEFFSDHGDDYQDFDITVADSTLYCLWTMQYLGNQYLEYARKRGRGTGNSLATTIYTNDTTLYAEMKYPRIGATTTLPDTTQLVYAFYSQENSGSGNHDLLYFYSENGGDSLTSTPDTLIQGSYSPVISDLRGYQVAPNQWMNITYCLTSSTPSFENFWCWSEEGSPTNWQGTTSIGTGANRSVPELVYSPGAPGGGSGVIYNDSLGNLWFDAPWFSGIAEDTGEEKEKIISQIVFGGSTVEIGSTGAVVYDVTGREIITLNTSTWDLKDGEGKEVKGGIYFIVDKEAGNRLKLLLMK